MDENILQAVKDAAIGMLRGHEPDVDVYAEEIMRTDRTLEPEDEDSSKWYFVEVIPASFTTISPDQTEAARGVNPQIWRKGHGTGPRIPAGLSICLRRREAGSHGSPCYHQYQRRHASPDLPSYLHRIGQAGGRNGDWDTGNENRERMRTWH